jgi:ABC-2 type transport system permease protein
VNGLRAMLALAEQQVVSTTKAWATELMAPIVSWAFFVLIFGATLNQRIGMMDGAEYKVFVVPGMVTMGLGFNATVATQTALWQARQDCSINDALCAPISPVYLMLGYLLGCFYRSLIVGAGLLGVGIAVAAVTIKAPLVLLAAVLLALVLFGAVGLMLGVLCRTPAQLQVALPTVIQPLTYTSGVYFARSLLSGRYRELIAFNPVYYVTQALRGGMLGTADEPIWLSLAITAALAAAALAIAVSLFASGRTLMA